MKSLRYETWLVIGVSLIVLGYGLLKSAGTVVHVNCERTESAFLPVCHLREYFLGLFPAAPTVTVSEITSLANRGKADREYFLLQRLPDRKLAPIHLNKMQAASEHAEPRTSLNQLAAFFRDPGARHVDVQLKNEAGSLPVGLILMVVGIGLVLYQRIDHQIRKPRIARRESSPK